MATTNLSSGPWARQVLAGLGGQDDEAPDLRVGGLGRQAAANYQAAARAMAERDQSARRTPSGRRQPPEVRGVDASPKVPNRLQPMSGEFDRGHEVGDGRPAFVGQGPEPTPVSRPRMGVPAVGMDRPLASAYPVGGSAGRRAGADDAWGSVRPFGAPTGMPASGVVSARSEGRPMPLGAVPTAFGWRPPVGGATPDLSGLAALPHFAGGGVLQAGGTGVVGEYGEEEVTALPGGGAQVTPLQPSSRPLAPAGLDPGLVALAGLGQPSGGPGATSLQPTQASAVPATTGNAAPAASEQMAPPQSIDLSGLGASIPAFQHLTSGVVQAPKIITSAPAPAAAPPAVDLSGLGGGLSPALQRSRGGYGITAPPPGIHDAADAYQQAVRRYASEQPPDPNNPAYQVSTWRKGLGAALGVGAAAFGRDPAAAAQIYGAVAGDPYASAETTYNQNRANELAGLGQMREAAAQQQTANDADIRAWEQQTEQAARQQAADNTEAYRQQEVANREAAEQRESALQNQLDAWRTAGGKQLVHTGDGRYFVYDTHAGTMTPALDAGGRPVTGSPKVAGATAAAPAAPALPRGSGKPLSDPQVAAQFLQAAGGDKVKARQLAQQNGWALP